ncbi:Uma2 family endonuclease [Spirosoma sp. 209]|uniref:Uma2 family endonuclease n=1 Tax=Spirosoma sp. 209 TaxID=1955701 RepID=UPI00098D043E|nr:Uma2 family endonuclease [Spirosoma sp. 209]
MQITKPSRRPGAISQRRRKATPEQYFAFEARSGRKHEYIDGEIRLMPYTSENHGLIVANLIALLHSALKGSGCRVYPSDRMLYVPPTGNYYYPDVMVVCGESLFHQFKPRMVATLNPTVLIEVLSESTGEYDETMKWYNYKQIDTLQQYVRVSQDQVRLDLYTRVGTTHDWLNTFAEQLDQTVTIGSCEIRVSEVYEHIITN